MWKKVKKATMVMVASALLAGTISPMQVYAAEPEELREQAGEAFKSREYEQAKELYEELVESGFAEDTDYLQGGFSQYVEGNYYIADQWFAKALELLKEGGSPNAAFAYKIRNSYQAKEYWYAGKDYESSVEADARTGMGCQFYAKALLDCKKPEEAIPLLEDAFKGYTGETYSQSVIKEDMGHAYLALENYEEAKKAYQEAFEIGGNEENYQKNMVKLRLKQDDSDTESVLAEVMPNATNAEKAAVLRDNGYNEEAITYYEKAWSEDGEEVRCDMANNYYQANDPESAVRVLEELLAEDPENDTALNMLGAIYCDALAQYDKAEEMFDRVIELVPNADITMRNKAIIYRKAGEFDKVAEQYKYVAEKFPKLKTSYLNYVSYKTDITAEEALKFFAGYEGWPSDERLQALMLGDAIDTEVMTAKTLESFLAYYEGLIEKYPDDYYLLYHKTQLLQGLERYEEALAACEQAAGISGVMSYYATNALGNLYYAMGDYDNAIACYEENVLAHNDNSLRLCMADCYISMADYVGMEQVLTDYLAEGGEEADAASYRMKAAYLQENYEALLSYADMVIAEDNRDAKAKAYKVVAMRELDMEGTDELIAEIDSQGFSAESLTLMTINSILGRFDKAREIYAVMQEHAPGVAITCKNNYEFKNLYTDAAFCEMAGMECKAVEIAGTEQTVAEAKTEAVNEQATQEANTEAKMADTETEAGKEAKENIAIPTVAGVTILISVLGILAVLLGKKRSDAKKNK